MADTALYGDLSHYYDLLCAQIDYREQCSQAQRLYQLFGAGGRDYLDLACGTGPHLEHFIAAGYRATGLDLNAPMLAQAARRCPAAQLSQQDMSSFHFEQQFDLITCFLYSMHYCYPSAKFAAAAACAYTALKPSGVFCFDAVDKNTIANDQGASHSETQGDAQFRFQSRWYYPGQGEQRHLHLRIERERAGARQIWQDQHTMVALDVPSLKQILTDTGFEVTLLKRDFGRIEAWDGKEGNLIVVCTKGGD